MSGILRLFQKLRRKDEGITSNTGFGVGAFE